MCLIFVFFIVCVGMSEVMCCQFIMMQHNKALSNVGCSRNSGTLIVLFSNTNTLNINND